MHCSRPNYGVYGFRRRPRTCLRVSLRRQPRIAQKAERVNELGGLICITRGLRRFPPKPLPPILQQDRCPCRCRYPCRPPDRYSRLPAIDHRVRARTFPATPRVLGLVWWVITFRAGVRGVQDRPCEADPARGSPLAEPAWYPEGIDMSAGRHRRRDECAQVAWSSSRRVGVGGSSSTSSPRRRSRLAASAHPDRGEAACAMTITP